jgi:hypothetical protein
MIALPGKPLLASACFSHLGKWGEAVHAFVALVFSAALRVQLVERVFPPRQNWPEPESDLPQSSALGFSLTRQIIQRGFGALRSIIRNQDLHPSLVFHLFLSFVQIRLVEPVIESAKTNLFPQVPALLHSTTYFFLACATVGPLPQFFAAQSVSGTKLALFKRRRLQWELESSKKSTRIGG